MKQPLIVLAICAITTFTMGWFGHRVFSKSVTPSIEQTIRPEPTNKIDSPAIIVKDTLIAKSPDTILQKIQEPETALAKPTIILASSTSDTLWNDAKEVIIKTPDGSIDIKRRFILNKTFRDFPAEKLKVKAPKELDFPPAGMVNFIRRRQKTQRRKELYLQVDLHLHPLIAAPDVIQVQLSTLKPAKFTMVLIHLLDINTKRTADY